MKIALKIWLILLAGCTLQACQDQKVKLFDGKSLEGWVFGPDEVAGHWRVENGLLVGENQDQLASILWTTGQYGDFELDLDYMTPSGDYDSGVFLRGESHQVQIGISRSLQKDMTGCIYAPIDEQGSYPAQTDKIKQYHHVGEWNHLKVILRGNRIQTFLNGEPFVDYMALRIPEKGPIGLQLHGGVHMVIKFRNIELTEYPREESL
ncbi:MAG: 3-keto-disaccharide hydrolase [Bacteroidales bacterium]